MKQTGNQAIQLVVLLGNPGKQYANTRHNVGWMVSSRLTTAPGSAWKEKFHGRFLKEGSIVILEPHTFMNHSGRSVQAAAAFFHHPPQAILVVHDDMETPFGGVTLTFGGGDRGNNGIRSIASSIGTRDFWRLRIGVGRPPSNRRPGDWILERFTPEEEAVLPDLLDRAANVIADEIRDPKERKERIG